MLCTYAGASILNGNKNVIAALLALDGYSALFRGIFDRIRQDIMKYLFYLASVGINQLDAIVTSFDIVCFHVVKERTGNFLD